MNTGKNIVEDSVVFVDCDADPFIPEGCGIIEHRRGGQFKCNFSNIELAGWDKQGYVTGREMRKKFLKKALNANVLDFLLKNPHLIPDKLKGSSIVFWGTLYRSREGGRFVRVLEWFNYTSQAGSRPPVESYIPYFAPRGPHWEGRRWDFDLSPNIYVSYLGTSTLAALKK